MKLNPEVKEKWTTRLRSGDIEQGKGVLRTLDDKRCCLGVLCDIAQEESIGHWVHREIEDEFHGETTEVWAFRTTNPLYRTVEDEEGVLPLAVAEWAGLITPNTSDPGSRSIAASCVYVRSNWEANISSRSLVDDNDEYDASFADIADIIEREF